MAYHTFLDEEGNELGGSFETFHESDPETLLAMTADRDEPGTAGWYWWACYPGCLPDGEAQGPFDSEQDAINDANGM